MARDRKRRTVAKVKAERAIAAQVPPANEPRPKSVGAFDNPAVERARAEVEACKIARRYVSQEEQKRDFLVARKAKVDELEALARQTLEANPCSKSADEEEEAQWRELAHASRQMRPLLEAIARASAKQPDYEKYRDGFDSRLADAMATVATLCSYGRLDPLNRQRVARNPRPKARSPFTEFIDRRLKRNWDEDQIVKALMDEARDGQDGRLFSLSDDGSTIFVTEDKRERKLKVSGIKSAISKLRRRGTEARK